MSGRTSDEALVRLAVGSGAVVLLAGVGALASGGATGTTLVGAVAAVGYGLAGGWLAGARPRNPLGWLLLAVGWFHGAAAVATVWAASDRAVGTPGREIAAWLGAWSWFPALALMPTAVLAVYPSGRADSRGRRLLIGLAALGTAGVSAALALSPEGVDDVVPGMANPFAAPAASTAGAVGGFVLLIPAVLVTLFDALRRLWQASSPEREQLAWFLLTVVVVVLVTLTPWTPPRAAVQGLVPFAIAVGVVRHRLLDLQVVVRRALLFAGLTAVVVLVFVTSTAALSGVVQGPLPVAVAAALVAVGLTPARDVLQRGVDRLVYGDRRDPMRAVARLGRHVAAEHDTDLLLPQVLGTVATAVRSPHVALLDPRGTPVAQAGSPGSAPPLRLPLQVGGRDAGCLQVAPRTPRDGWSSQDRALLDVLARQVAVVAHADRLNTELTASRDRVLQATAEERCRLHQELHDGLGPALSGIALGLEAAEAALDTAPQRVAPLLTRLRQEAQGAGREVRRLVEGLRPAALDRQGLDSALAAFVAGLQDACLGRLDITLELPEDLPALPPQVDAAAYRIVTEAVTNVVRHSGAHLCQVTVSAEPGVLRLVVQDDGAGLPVQPRDGVGLASMRRRAAGLGGTWAAGPGPGGGTRLEVALPAGCTAEAPA